MIENIIKRFRDEKFLFKILYFVSILTIFALVLSYLMALRPDMTFFERQVGGHTSFVLGLMGLKSDFYEYVVRIPDSNQKQAQIVGRLSNYDFELVHYSSGTELRSKHLNPFDERIVSEYVMEIMREGLPIYTSKSTVMMSNGIILGIDIIAECIGWVGLFVITALIIAYPKAPIEKRLLGLFVSWPLMYMMNIVRLSTTMYMGYVGGARVFEFTHDIFWRSILVLWALILWTFWVYFVVREENISDITRKFRKRKKRMEFIQRKIS